MNRADINSTIPFGQVNATPAVRVKPSTSMLQCLIVSAVEGRRVMLQRAASEGGWNTVVCADMHTALSEFHQTRFRLVLVDLEGSEAADNFAELSEQLASQSSNMLVAVCGHDGDAMEEIWARQLGVWLYLPGVTEGDDLSALCGEACGVAEQLMKNEMLAVA